MTETRTTRRPPAATAVALLATAGAIGAVAMTVFHVDLYRDGAVPVFVPAGFAVGAVVFAVVAYGAWRRAAWAWPVALAVNGLGFASAVFPWRGAQALLPAAVTLAALAVLLSPRGRAALLTGSAASRDASR